MKIISNFKDYYDWVAQRYGGGDPLNVWLRQDTVEPPRQDINDVIFSVIKTPYLGVTELSWERKNEHWGWYMQFCSLNGKAYPLVGKCEMNSYHEPFDWEEPKLLRENDPFIDFYLQQMNDSKYTNSLRIKEQLELWLNPKESSLLLKAHQALKQPAFLVANREAAYGRLPRLGELGFAALFSAEQMYQNLSYFVGNYLRDSADLNPPATVSDRDRIVQHGFDLKKSFRH